MFARIEIDGSRCKGCGLCTGACPRLLLELDVPLDETVHACVMVLDQEKCVGCAQCAEMCPDLAICVYSRQKNEFTGRAAQSFREYSSIVLSLIEKPGWRNSRVFSVKKIARAR